MLKRLAKIFIIYLMSCLGISFVFSFFYKLTGTEMNFFQIVFHSFLICFNNGILREMNLFSAHNSLIALNQFAGQLMFVILTGYTVSVINNSSNRYIRFADKMIVRKRETSGMENQITLSFMAINKCTDIFYDVCCEITCFHYKDNNAKLTNRTYLKKYFPDMINFYRYSFELDELPLEFWETLISQEGINYNELAVEVRLIGKLENHNGEISIRKSYSMSDVIIAAGTKNIVRRTALEGNFVKKSKPKWQNLNRIILYYGKEQEELKEKIKDYIENKKSTLNNPLIIH